MQSISFDRKRIAGAFSSVAFVTCCLAAWTATAFSAEPARKWTVYLLPHSHIDIGYTHLQPEVEQLQIRNLDIVLDLCQKTADYPADARFKWNSEVHWPVDCYLRKSSPEKQQRLMEAIRAGQIGLDALYGNELTGLCRPEELLRLCESAKQLAERCGVKAESAMISDVPGLTWGTVPALAQAGVKYMSLGNNFLDGGLTLAAWEDKPFYWLAPDGRQKLLCWLPYKGYALAHENVGGYKLEQLPELLAKLEKKGYPYDILHLRWQIAADNGPPDASLPDVVKRWNSKPSNIRVVIATTSTAFRELEKRFADKIPVVSGDFTPYWENGACSSARETAVNRTAAERLVQSEILSAIFSPQHYSAEQFAEAWRQVILYDEHTWGAYNSISEPDKPFVKDQWKIKQAFALDGDRQSQKLLKETLDQRGNPIANCVDVFNTSSWPRTDLVILDKASSVAGDIVSDPDGKNVPSQRLSTGELAFLAQDMPALAGRRYTIRSGKSLFSGQAKAQAHSIAASKVSTQLNAASGAIESLRIAGVDAELCNAESGLGLNRYCYVLDNHVKEAQKAGSAKITVKESGPLVASLLVESSAPGCVAFQREIRIIDGLDRVDIVNVIDKKAVRAKEGVYLGFAFNVPDGVMRMDIPLAVMRPEADQIAGSCKNWFSVGRWVDVSNAKYGVTWATLDAPMVEVGAICATRMDGPGVNPADWIAKLEPSQTLYSMVMNNHWHTNYKADQEGPTTFRYAISAHGPYDAGAAQRFGIEQSQPLVVAPARGNTPKETSLMTVEPSGVVVTSLQPIDGGKQIAVRLFNATGVATTATLRGTSPAQQPLTIEMAPWEVVVRNIAAE